jgi:hypothetical protein
MLLCQWRRHSEPCTARTASAGGVCWFAFLGVDVHPGVFQLAFCPLAPRGISGSRGPWACRGGDGGGDAGRRPGGTSGPGTQNGDINAKSMDVMVSIYASDQSKLNR